MGYRWQLMGIHTLAHSVHKGGEVVYFNSLFCHIPNCSVKRRRHLINDIVNSDIITSGMVNYILV